MSSIWHLFGYCKYLYFNSYSNLRYHLFPFYYRDFFIIFHRAKDRAKGRVQIIGETLADKVDNNDIIVISLLKISLSVSLPDEEE